MRLCGDARDGRLRNHDACLKMCLRKIRGKLTIPTRFAPLLYLMLSCEAKATQNLNWLKWANSGKVLAAVGDAATKEFLEFQYKKATQ